ncbi:MAG: formylglycine-generating enzyme family protein [Acidobacteria bacterium]|nr:formylglycine-generating enzyme family protein [Acidobacteriota bacterium]
MILTDGVSAAWQNGNLSNTLIGWGSQTPVVICQMLGESLWKSTILGEPDVIVRTGIPGVPNKRLEVERPWWAEAFHAQETDLPNPTKKPVQLAIPIVSLKPELIEDWAKMLMGQGIPYSATLVSASPGTSKIQPHVEPLERMNPEESLERFRMLVSSETYRLAGYLSWMPLTLPVIQLVHYRMIANCKQEQLAELLLGGILKRQIPSEPKGEVEYEFVDGVREQLQSEATNDLEQVLACVSAYVEHQLGKPFDFLACMIHPQGKESLPAIARPFARISIPVLRRLGLTHLTLSDFEELPPLPPTFTNSIGMEFVLIPAGSFLMGSPETEAERYLDERPQHKVTFSKPFYLGKFQVTQAQWQAVMGTNPSYFKGDNLPVEQVSWNDCQEFLKRLNAKQDGYSYRLPTEAEWEYACRAGTRTPFSFGETITTDQVNYNGNYPYGDAPKGEYRGNPTSVGSFPPNAWGLHDMHGNTWEWCQDVWHDTYDDAPTDGSAWEGEFDNEYRMMRGGSWGSSARLCRSAFRDSYFPEGDDRVNSFRVVAVRTLNT